MFPTTQTNYTRVRNMIITRLLTISVAVLQVECFSFPIISESFALQRRCFMSSHENLSLLQVTAADRDSNGLQEQGPGPETPDQGSRGQVDNIRRGLRRLAQLSLDDYEWRMSLFREKEADRRVEESLARMLGEDASYFRPMDASASKMGPLGRAEKSAVEWLALVIDEEGRRAKKIVNADGELVRPIDIGGKLGPLGKLEQAFVEFLNSIRNSERQRVERGVWRPKDMEEPLRGPLGQLELSVVSALQKIQESEMLRMEQSRQRGGEMVRPIDVPGPLGDFELAVADLIKAEKLRAIERQEKNITVRPMDANVKGQLGEFEMQAVQAVRQLTEEERERLRNIQRKLQDSRPMTSDKDSPLGIIETIAVNILRAPALVVAVVLRVHELLKSEDLDENDKELLREQTTKNHEKECDNKND